MGHGEADGPDRLGRAAARRPGDPGDADADLDAGETAHAFGHRHRDHFAHGAVGGDVGLGHAEQRHLGGVAVGDDGTLDPRRAAGDVGQPRRDEPAGARLGHRDLPAAGREQVADHGFDRSPVGADHVRAEHAGHFVDAALQRRRRGGGIGASVELQLELPGGRQDRRFDRHVALGPGAIERLQALLGVRLAEAGDQHRAHVHACGRRPCREGALEQRLEHRLELARRPGQQDQHLRPMLDPLPRRGAVDVVEHHAVLDDERLPPVDRRHRDAAGREAGFESGDDGGVLDQRPADHAGDGLARHVIVGRAQTAGQDDQVGARQRVRDDAGQRIDAIADDVLGADADAEPGQAVGDRQRVGVETRRDQQLAADRHDLRRGERRQDHSHNNRRNAQSRPRMIA